MICEHLSSLVSGMMGQPSWPILEPTQWANDVGPTSFASSVPAGDAQLNQSNATPLACFLFLLPGLMVLIPACLGGALGA